MKKEKKVIVTDENTEVHNVENASEVCTMLLKSYLTAVDIFLKDHPAECADCEAYQQQVKVRYAILKAVGIEK